MAETNTLEVPAVGDLAQAIVALGRAAERRRGAYAELAEATDTIAKAIREQLRTGDEVSIENGGYYCADRVCPPAYRVDLEGRPVLDEDGDPIGAPSGPWTDVLRRAGAILANLEGGTWMNPKGWLLHPAAAADRQAFVGEAETVIKAFRELLDQQARDYGDASDKAVKLTPR